MTAVPDAYEEFCLISVMNNTAGDGSGEIAFAGFTEDITAMDFGEKDIEGVPLLNGGRIVKFTPMTDESITMKVYPVTASLEEGGAVQLFHPQSANDTTQPILVSNSKERIPYRVVILLSTRLPNSATALPNSGEPSYRFQVVNAYCTRYVPSFDGKIYSAEITFKWAPFDEFGTGNKQEESADGTVCIAATATASSTALTYIDIGV